MYNRIELGQYDYEDNDTFEKFKNDILKIFDLQNNEKGEMLFAIAYEMTVGKGKIALLEKMYEIYGNFKVVKDYFEKGESSHAETVSDRNQTNRRSTFR